MRHFEKKNVKKISHKGRARMCMQLLTGLRSLENFFHSLMYSLTDATRLYSCCGQMQQQQQQPIEISRY